MSGLIVVCIILHNTFVTFDDKAWEEEDEEIINEELGEVVATYVGVNFRQRVQNKLVMHYI